MLVMWMHSMRALWPDAAAYDVDFFGVHEEALIEAADFRKGDMRKNRKLPSR